MQMCRSCQSSRPSRLAVIVAIAFGAVALSTGVVSAMVFQHEEHLHISNLHRIEDDYYAYAQDLTIDGYIDGELAAFTYNFSQNGEVTGTANVFAYQFSHRGIIGRSLRGFANSATIDGSIGHSLLLLASDITISQPAVVERDARLYGQNVRMYGTINGNVDIRGKSIIIEGFIGGDLNVHTSGEIVIASTAIIGGSLNYESPEEKSLEIAEGAVVTGGVHWSPPLTEEENKDAPAVKAIILAVSKLLAAFLLGVILVAVFRRQAEESFAQLRSRTTTSIAVGFVVLIGFALALIILAIAVALLIAGLLLMSGESAVVGALLLVLSTLTLPISSFAAVSGGILLYAGKIMVAFLIGTAIVGRLRRSARALSAWHLFVGLTIFALVFAIPYLGFLVYLLVTVTGAGAIALGVHHCRRPIAATTVATTSPPPTPPPTRPD